MAGENRCERSKKTDFALDQWKGICLNLKIDFENIPFETFDFADLNDGDPDNSWLVKSILFCLYKDQIQDLKGIHQIGTGKMYRGDTMNSFNALFRWWRKEPDDDKTKLGDNKRLVIKRLRTVLGETEYQFFCKKIEEFHHAYHKLGNFILLPNRQIKGNTLNTFRGKERNLQDFFDLFLCELKAKMETGKCMAKLEEFFNADSYRRYFDSFGENNDKFEKFCESNLLEMYLEPASREVIRYAITQSEYFKKSKYNKAYQWRILKLPTFTDKKVKTYYNDAVEYINEATKRIDLRSGQMIQKLKKPSQGQTTEERI